MPVPDREPEVIAREAASVTSPGGVAWARSAGITRKMLDARAEGRVKVSAGWFGMDPQRP